MGAILPPGWPCGARVGVLPVHEAQTDCSVASGQRQGPSSSFTVASAAWPTVLGGSLSSILGQVWKALGPEVVGGLRAPCCSACCQAAVCLVLRVDTPLGASEMRSGHVCRGSLPNTPLQDVWPAASALCVRLWSARGSPVLQVLLHGFAEVPHSPFLEIQLTDRETPQGLCRHSVV